MKIQCLNKEGAELKINTWKCLVPRPLPGVSLTR